MTKIWDPNSAGIAEFDTLDYIEVYGDVNSFQGALQVSVKESASAKRENTILPTTSRKLQKYR